MDDKTRFSARRLVYLLVLFTVVVGAVTLTPAQSVYADDCTVSAGVVQDATPIITGTNGANTINCAAALHGHTINALNNVDTVTGSSTADDTINGGNGNDIISDAGGTNTLNGEVGEDNITGGAGDDTINGGAGVDTISDPGGTNTINGDGSADGITGGAGNDTINGGDGGDTINDPGGTNTVNGDAGDDQITTGDGDDTITGGSGDNTINAGNGTNNVTGGDNEDTITTGSGNDTINGGLAPDIIDAGDGNNTVMGGNADDTITTGSGDDNIDAGLGDDTVNAGGGNDFISGGSESLVGGNNDDLNGEGGNDIILGLAGDDDIDGGDGLDYCDLGPDETAGDLPLNCEDADLTATKTNNTGGTGSVGVEFQWTIVIDNSGAAAFFMTGEVILTDDLPAGATYSLETPISSGVIVGDFSCALAVNIVRCTATSDLYITTGGSITVVVNVTPTANGPLDNPGTGTCAADPADTVLEVSEANSCSDVVTVGEPAALDLPDLIIVKECLSANGDGDADFNVLVSTELGVAVAVDALDCGEVMVVADLDEGTYRIQEFITGPDANSFVTAIVCSTANGQTVTPGSLAEVDLEAGSDAECAIVNVFDPDGDGVIDPTDPGTPPAPPTIIVPIDIDNANSNTLNNDNVNDNNNVNTNTQEQSNKQEQTNDNNQTTTVNSSPSVVIDFDE